MNRIVYFALSLSVLLALFAGVEAVPAPRNAAVSKRTSAADVKAYLAAHNNFRAKHGASAFKWNNTLAAAAQKEVNRCIFKHSGGIFGPYGGTSPSPLSYVAQLDVVTHLAFVQRTLRLALATSRSPMPSARGRTRLVSAPLPRRPTVVTRELTDRPLVHSPVQPAQPQPVALHPGRLEGQQAGRMRRQGVLEHLRPQVRCK